MSSNRSKILFLPGVFLKDCPGPDEESSDEVVEVHLSSDEELDSIATDITQLEPVIRPRSVIKKYDTIPTQFTRRELWPTSSNLLCWFCDRDFTGMPWPVITGCSKTLVSDDSDGSDISDAILLNSLSAFNEILLMDTHGNFCQSGCSMAYIDLVNDPKIVNKYESKRLLKLFAEIMTRTQVNHIPSSDVRTCMQKYCGPGGKTEEKYREENEQRSGKYTIAIEKSTLSSVIVRSNK